MEPLSLEQLSLISISMAIWRRREYKPYMIKQPNGLVTLEKALPLIEARINNYPIAGILKNRLLNFIHRTGYELYCFLNKFMVRNNAEILHIFWTFKGVINEIRSLRYYLDSIEEYNVKHFQLACIMFDEMSARKMWSLLPEKDREAYRINCNILYPAYWIYEIENCIAEFAEDYGSLIIGFNYYINLNVNMFWHSVAVNNKNAIYYFYNKLTASELLLDRSFEQSLLKYIIESGRSEGFRFLMSCLERPFVDDQIQQLIINTSDCEYLKHLLDYILRHVNIFGDLHYKIFCYLLMQTSRKYSTIVKDNLEIYALTLLTKGRFEKFDFISEFDAKEVLYLQVHDHLLHKYSFSIFVSIHFNRHTDLLREFFNWLATTDEDRNLFERFMNGLINGTLNSY